MKKYFVISDIHSFFDEMIEALNKAGFDRDNPEHILISCGDLFDRGGQTLECLMFIMSIPEERRILIKGNHEYLLEQLLRGRYPSVTDWHNGTLKTIQQLTDWPVELGIMHEWPEVLNKLSKIKLLWDYLNSCIDYYELNNYIFVHGWTPGFNDLSKYDKYAWEDFRWDNGFACYLANEEKLKESGKIIVFGHWHTSWAHSRIDHNGSEFGEDACFDIYRNDNIIGIDACTAHTHKVNVLVIEV